MPRTPPSNRLARILAGLRPPFSSPSAPRAPPSAPSNSPGPAAVVPVAAEGVAAAAPARLRVAAIISVYGPLQHADVIVTKFLKGMSTDDGFTPPQVDVVSMWIDCVLHSDIGLMLAEQHGVPVFSTIRQALHVGGDKLDVDAVLLVGECAPSRPPAPPTTPDPMAIRPTPGRAGTATTHTTSAAGTSTLGATSSSRSPA